MGYVNSKNQVLLSLHCKAVDGQWMVLASCPEVNNNLCLGLVFPRGVMEGGCLMLSLSQWAPLWRNCTHSPGVSGAGSEPEIYFSVLRWGGPTKKVWEPLLETMVFQEAYCRWLLWHKFDSGGFQAPGNSYLIQLHFEDVCKDFYSVKTVILCIPSVLVLSMSSGRVEVDPEQNHLQRQVSDHYFYRTSNHP